MSATLHAAIKRSRAQDSDLHRLMNLRRGEWGLINGQLAHYGRRVRRSDGSYITDDTKVDRFVKHTFMPGSGSGRSEVGS